MLDNCAGVSFTVAMAFVAPDSCAGVSLAVALAFRAKAVVAAKAFRAKAVRANGNEILKYFK